MTSSHFACKMPPRMLTRLALAFLLALLPLAGGCGGLPAANAVVVYTMTSPELSMSSIDPETGSWESAPWEAGDTGWLPYPPRGQLQVEHNLGHTPRTIIVYLAFDRAGTSPAQAAGDLARVVDVDASTLTLWNATNGSYFARIVAR